MASQLNPRVINAQVKSRDQKRDSLSEDETVPAAKAGDLEIRVLFSKNFSASPTSHVREGDTNIFRLLGKNPEQDKFGVIVCLEPSRALQFLYNFNPKELDFVIGSHNHVDHIGGMKEGTNGLLVTYKKKVRRYWWCPYVSEKSKKLVEPIRKHLDDNNMEYDCIYANDIKKFGRTRIMFL